MYSNIMLSPKLESFTIISMMLFVGSLALYFVKVPNII